MSERLRSPKTVKLLGTGVIHYLRLFHFTIG